MEKKYKLTEETINMANRTLYRIEALRDFGNVKKGDKGGYVEKESNLSQYGDCWVYDNTKVYGNAMVYDNAKIYGNAVVCDNAMVYNNAKVYDNVMVCDDGIVYGDAEVCGKAEVCDNAEICGNAIIANDSDYIVFKNWWSSGRHFTWTRSNNMWKVGCFYGTGKGLIDKAYRDSEISGREYERVVKYVESIIKEE